MRKPKTRSFPLLVLFLAAGLAGGCGPRKIEGPVRIAVIKGQSDMNWSEFELGARLAAEKTQADLQFLAPSSAARQVSAIQETLQLMGHAIVIDPIDDPEVRRAVQEASRKVPVVTVGNPGLASESILFVGTDHEGMGEAAGEQMLIHTGGYGKVAILSGSVESSETIARIRGFRKATQKLPEEFSADRERAMGGGDMEIVARYDDQGDPEKARSYAASAVQLHPGLTGIFGASAHDGPAAAQALVDAGVQERIKIIVCGMTPQTPPWIQSGVIQAALVTRPDSVGQNTITILVRMVREGRNPVLRDLNPRNHIFDTGLDVVTKQSLNLSGQEDPGGAGGS